MVHTVSELITPELAAQYLTMNSHNRVLRQPKVNTIAAAITRGEWEHTGQAVQFDTNGVLLDGQHRLWAIVQSGVAVNTEVTRGIAPRAFRVIDTHTTRSAGQVLSMRGVPDANRVAAGLRFLAVYDHWLSLRATGNYRTTLVSAYATVKLTNAEMEGALDKHPGISAWLRESRMIGSRIACLSESGSLDAALYLMEQEKDASYVSEFADGVATGVGLLEGDPRVALRNRTAPNPLGKGNNAHSVAGFMLLGKAWRLWLAGTPSVRLVIAPGEFVPLGTRALRVVHTQRETT